MKLALALVVVMSTWAMLMFAATSRDPEVTKPKPKPPPPPPPSTFPPPETMQGFDLDDSTGASYSKFIRDLRATLANKNRSYFGVPMIRYYDRLQYMYVGIESLAGNSITLAIRMNDLYVDGYSYKYQGHQLRARFLKLEPAGIQQDVQKHLFTNATNTDKDIGYVGSYAQLEAKAQLINRMNLSLGSPSLETYINGITYKDPKTTDFIKTEARLLLIVIQMVSEAIRFKYIENKINENFFDGYFPDFRAIDLEQNWAKLSKVITAANSKGEIPKNELQNLKLRNADGSTQNIRNVYDITVDMGLLNYIAPSLSEWLMMQPSDDVTVWVQ